MIRVRSNGRDLTESVTGLRYSNVNPGGFESASFSIAASVAPNAGETLRIDDGALVLWEGRVEDVDLDIGATDRRNVTAYGFGILLKRKILELDFVQSSLSGWVGPSLARRTAASGAGFIAEAGESSGGALRTKLAQPTWTAGSLPLTDMWYFSPGPIGRIQGRWTRSGAGVGTGGTSHEWSVILSDDDVPTPTYDGGTDLEASGPSSFGVDATTNTRRYALLQYSYGAAFGTDDSVDRAIAWDRIKVFGNHDITVQGTADNAGLYGGDIVRYLLAQIDGIDPGLIDSPTDWIVSQLAFGGPVDYESALVELDRQFGYDWGTWDSGSLFDSTPRFDWTAKQTSPKWVLRRSETESINLDSSLSQMADTLIVKYEDASGSPQSDTFTSTVRALSDAGISGQEQTLDAGVAVGDGPDRHAEVFFDLQGQDPPMSGTIDLAGSIRLAGGGIQAAHSMRADGSLLRVEDLLPVTEVYDLTNLRQTILPIKRVEVDASGEKPRTSVSVDQGSDSMSVLTSRMGAGLAAANL